MSATLDLLHEGRAELQGEIDRLIKTRDRFDRAIAKCEAAEAPPPVAVTAAWPFVEHRSMAEVLADHDSTGAA